jgi:hypothetical protein
VQSLTAALDQRAEPLTLFFRDDDAGWDMPRLDALLGIFAEQDCPIDLAVIPAALTEDLASALNQWRRRHIGIRLHQHGYAHFNHEPEGARKCEFGTSRPLERQCADILIGRERLSAMLGTVDPIFTPPWNRCQPETIARLAALGFKAFSDDGKAEQAANGLAHVPVDLDWDRARNSGQQLHALETLIASSRITAGIMLHHATMSSAALAELSQVIGHIRPHPGLHLVNLRDLLEFPS